MRSSGKAKTAKDKASDKKPYATAAKAAVAQASSPQEQHSHGAATSDTSQQVPQGQTTANDQAVATAAAVSAPVPNTRTAPASATAAATTAASPVDRVQAKTKNQAKSALTVGAAKANSRAAIATATADKTTAARIAMTASQTPLNAVQGKADQSHSGQVATPADGSGNAATNAAAGQPDTSNANSTALHAALDAVATKAVNASSLRHHKGAAGRTTDTGKLDAVNAATNLTTAITATNQLLPSANGINNASAPLQPQPNASAPPIPVPLNGLAVAIATRAQAGQNRFDIRLDPPDLGRIDVHLHVDAKGQVTSHLIVDRPDTLNLLQRDVSDLQRSLQQAGLKTADNGMQFSLRDQSLGANTGGNTGSSYQPPAAHVVIPETDMTAADTITRSYMRIAHVSGIDIRV